MADRSDPAFVEAVRLAIERLARSDRFSGDIRSWLAGRGVEADTIADALAYLERRGFVDDSRTATDYVRKSGGKTAKGRAKLATEMETKGASDKAIEEALAAIDPDAELEKAVGLLVAKKFLPKDRARAGRLLYYRGFEQDTVEAALNRVLGELD